MINLVVIDSNEKTSAKKVYNQDKLVQWIQWLENEGRYRWLDPFGSPKKTFLLIMHFAKPRVYRANTHPGHRNRRRTSTIIFVSNCSGTETDETDESCSVTGIQNQISKSLMAHYCS